VYFCGYSCVDLQLRTNNSTVIRGALVFGEQLFEGESLYVSPKVALSYLLYLQRTECSVIVLPDSGAAEVDCTLRPLFQGATSEITIPVRPNRDVPVDVMIKVLCLYLPYPGSFSSAGGLFCVAWDTQCVASYLSAISALVFSLLRCVGRCL
jgi:hypothetical protein